MAKNEKHDNRGGGRNSNTGFAGRVIDHYLIS